MAKYALQHHFDSFLADALEVIRAYRIDFDNADHGQTGLKVLHNIHTIISRNRAYDDEHPCFVQKRWARVLPYDGRDYCFLYEDENGEEKFNDDHVQTLLRRVKAAIEGKTFAPYSSLALGTRFSYVGSERVWVKLRHNSIAEWDERYKTSNWVGQQLCSFEEPDGNFDQLVEVY